jgi:hypothetical protein
MLYLQPNYLEYLRQTNYLKHLGIIYLLLSYAINLNIVNEGNLKINHI